MSLIIDRDYPISYKGEPIYRVRIEAQVGALPWTANETAENLAEQLIIEARNKGIKIMHLKVWIDDVIPFMVYKVTVEYLGAFPPTATMAVPAWVGWAVIIGALTAAGIVVYFIISKIKEPVYELPPWTPLDPSECEKAGAVYDAEKNKCIPRGKIPEPTLVTLGALIIFGVIAINLIKKG